MTEPERRRVVMFSGGLGSWAAGMRVAERYGTNRLTLLFADTLIEDEDLYRFLPEAAASIGGELVVTAEGRTPWQVFNDVRLIGNTRADPCSRILKREHLRRWLEANCDPESTTVYLGIDWTEEHRFIGAQRFWAPWHVEAPLCDRPYRWKQDYLSDLHRLGIKPPRLYEMGFSHNNCGGFCVKAGHGQFAKLLEAMPARYADHEAQEEAFRARLGKDVAILRDRAGGETKPLPLRVLRERIEAGHEVDLFDIGGCDCFTPPEGGEGDG